MIRIDCIWLASFVLSTSNLRGGIDKLLAQVVHGFALGARTHHAYVFANWRADRLKVLMFNVFGMWLCTRRLQSGSLRGRARTRAPWSSAVSSSTVDTAFKDRAAEDVKLPAPSPPRANGQAMRQALPASLPRIEHRHEIPETHCACGQAVERIGREAIEQLDCVPAPFFVLCHIRAVRSKYAWRVLPDDCGCPHPRTDDRQGHPGPRSAGPGGGGQARRPPASVPPRREI